MKKQTAVDWLVNEINKLDMPINDSQHDIALDIIDKAKEMEKAQKANEYIRGYNDAKQIDILLNELNK